MRHGTGPPEDGEGRASPANVEEAVTTPPTNSDHATSLRRQSRLRRDAAARSVPLPCGCRDPWPCRRCTQPPLTEQALDGWRDAALYVLANGQTPLVPLEVRLALWRRQGADRLLAKRLHQACGGVVS
jgi:hypothetical protein